MVTTWLCVSKSFDHCVNELFDRLDAPVGRVGALDTWVGYNPQLENEILPQVENLAAEAERLLQF